MGEKLTTGDENADKVLQQILDRVDRLPECIRTEIRDGVSPIFFVFCYVATVANIKEDLVQPAMERIEALGYIRTDLNCYGHGAHVWMRQKALEA